MARSVLLLVVLLALAGLALPAYTFVPGKSLGPVHLGMTMEQLKQALHGVKLDYDEADWLPKYYICNPARPAEVYATFSFSTMLAGPEGKHYLDRERPRLVSISFLKQSYRMAGFPGLGVGATKEAILAHFGPPTSSGDKQYKRFLNYEKSGMVFALEGDGRTCSRVELYSPGKYTPYILTP